MQVNIFDQSFDELKEFFASIDQPEYRARQVFQWLYEKNEHDFQAMSNISLSVRQILQETFDCRLPSVDEVLTDPDDGTQKLVIELLDGIFIESVLIYEPDKVTLCISSQAGCPLGCKFCYTGIHGYIRNLSQGEILAQYLLAKTICTTDRISNIVFMGMGEPLLNYEQLAGSLNIFISENGFGFSQRRITVSTSGIIPGIKKFGDDFPKMNLALSLNSASEDQRREIMPVSKKYPLQKLLAALKKYPLPPRKRFTIEYVLIKNINDSQEDAERLVKLLKGIRTKINLIAINGSGSLSYQPPDHGTITSFQQRLISAGLTVMLRKSKGASINAACGQLSGEKNRMKIPGP